MDSAKPIRIEDVVMGNTNIPLCYEGVQNIAIIECCSVFSGKVRFSICIIDFVLNRCIFLTYILVYWYIFSVNVVLSYTCILCKELDLQKKKKSCFIVDMFYSFHVLEKFIHSKHFYQSQDGYLSGKSSGSELSNQVAYKKCLVKCFFICHRKLEGSPKITLTSDGYRCLDNLTDFGILEWLVL